MWVEFVVNSPLAPRNFSPGAAISPPLILKNQHFQIPIRSGMADESLCGCAATKSLFIIHLRSTLYSIINSTTGKKWAQLL